MTDVTFFFNLNWQLSRNKEIKFLFNFFSDPIVPLCSKTDRNSQPGVNCMVADSKQGAINVYRVIKPELYKRAIASKCTDTKLKSYMTEREIIDFVAQNYGLQDHYQIQNDLSNFCLLVFSNPLWGISVIQGDDADNMKETPVDTLVSSFIAALRFCFFNSRNSFSYSRTS